MSIVVMLIPPMLVFTPFMIMMIIGIPVISIARLVVRGIIITITAIIPHTTCQHKSNEQHYSQSNYLLFVHWNHPFQFNLVIESLTFKVKGSSLKGFWKRGLMSSSASYYSEADLRNDNYELKVSKEAKIIGLGNALSD
jgi:hypothetical protein